MWGKHDTPLGTEDVGAWNNAVLIAQVVCLELFTVRRRKKDEKTSDIGREGPDGSHCAYLVWKGPALEHEKQRSSWVHVRM